MLTDTNHWLIIPAAGVGQRMQAAVPKQYLTIHDKTILEYVIDFFIQQVFVKKILLVLHAKDAYGRRLFANNDRVQIVAGGEQRFHSVFNALQTLQGLAQAADWVLIHDAVRPGITDDDLKRLMQAVQNHPVGGILATPVTQTLKQVNAAQEIVATINRDNLWQAQTPQVFRYELLVEAMTKVLADNVIITDDAAAIEYLGYQPLIVPGNPGNIKITYPEDLRSVSRP